MWKQCLWRNGRCFLFYFSSHQFSPSVMSDTLQPHGLKHARHPCPSPTPRAYSNSCLLSWWCHPTISSSVVPFLNPLFAYVAHEGVIICTLSHQDGSFPNAHASLCSHTSSVKNGDKSLAFYSKLAFYSPWLKGFSWWVWRVKRTSCPRVHLNLAALYLNTCFLNLEARHLGFFVSLGQ